MKKTIIALSLAALSLPALAQQKAPEPDYTISGNFGVVSDYRFRGISQSNTQPAVQGGIDFAHKSGFYLGNWNSSVSSWAAYGGAGLEMDLYGGYKTELAGIGLDFGAISYYYPGAFGYYSDTSKNIFNTQEAYVGVSYGPVSFKTSYTLSKNYFGLGKDTATSELYEGTGLSSSKSAKGTLYYDLTFAYEVAPKLTLKAHAGVLDLKNGTSWGVTDYAVGFAYALPDNWAVGLTAYSLSLGKNAKDSGWFEYETKDGSFKKLYKTGAALSLTKTF